jgi:5-methylcytosine-specific restriction endonuclease McrA
MTISNQEREWALYGVDRNGLTPDCPATKDAQGVWRRKAGRRRRSNADFRSQVLDRDGHTCVECGSTDRLHAHHVVPVAVDPKLAEDVSNGVTLCPPCHGGKHPDLPAKWFI